MTDHNPYRSDARGWPDEDLEVPPHGLDLDAIVQVGRRQVRRQRMAMVGGTAAVLAAVAAIPAMVPLRQSGGGGDVGGPPPSIAPLPVLDCDITELPTPDEYPEPGPDTFSYAHLAAMDPTGRYVVGNAYLRTLMEGGRSSRSDPVGVVLWDDRQPTMPSSLRGNVTAYHVSADGVVVGGGEDGLANSYAWIYIDGQLSQLPTPDGYESAEANAINAAGDVSGTVADPDGQQTVVVWPADDFDNPRVLPPSPGRDVVASGINDDGLVVAEYYVRNPGGESDAGIYVWEPDGTLAELPVPDEAYDVFGTAVRGDWAAGQALTEPEGPQNPATGAGVSLRWDLRTRTLQVVAELGAAPNQVQHVNAAGDLLFLVPPAVVLGGEAYALPDPIEDGAVTPPDEAATPMVTVHSISDDRSTIAGEVYFDAPDAMTRLVIWRC